MRRMQRLVLLATLVVVTPAIVGCADFDADKFDVFKLNEKKKLPGDRQPLFPEGVPGVTQGMPADLMKGNQPPPEAALSAPVEGAPTAAVQTQAAPPPEPPAAAKPHPTPKPKKTVMRAPPPPRQQAAPVKPVTQEAAPWPEPAQGQATGTSPWPSAPPPGTFSR
jgi:hypothetical protein